MSFSSLIKAVARGDDTWVGIPIFTTHHFFQNWILIHDDIEDESELRRGQPVLHRKYTIPLAINAGDSLHGRMWSLLHGNHSLLGSELALDIIDEFIR